MDSRLIVAESAGFCFGVGRAVKMAEEASTDTPIYTLGKLVHNERVTRDLEERKVFVINSPEEAPEGSQSY